jgi:hypothetical protein
MDGWEKPSIRNVFIPKHFYSSQQPQLHGLRFGLHFLPGNKRRPRSLRGLQLLGKKGKKMVRSPSYSSCQVSNPCLSAFDMQTFLRPARKVHWEAGNYCADTGLVHSHNSPEIEIWRPAHLETITMKDILPSVGSQIWLKRLTLWDMKIQKRSFHWNSFPILLPSGVPPQLPTKPTVASKQGADRKKSPRPRFAFCWTVMCPTTLGKMVVSIQPIPLHRRQHRSLKNWPHHHISACPQARHQSEQRTFMWVTILVILAITNLPFWRFIEVNGTLILIFHDYQQRTIPRCKCCT